MYLVVFFCVLVQCGVLTLHSLDPGAGQGHLQTNMIYSTGGIAQQVMNTNGLDVMGGSRNTIDCEMSITKQCRPSAAAATAAEPDPHMKSATIEPSRE